jgi:hypothetical protein
LSEGIFPPLLKVILSRIILLLSVIDTRSLSADSIPGLVYAVDGLLVEYTYNVLVDQYHSPGEASDATDDSGVPRLPLNQTVNGWSVTVAAQVLGVPPVPTTA